MAEKKKKASAMRKLIPAVAMLTTSAVMLSSATYAWFTLNKEVEITGLQMEAIAGDSLEISLGKYSDSIKSITAPTDKNDKSWKRSVSFGDYYKAYGALKPASSDTGLQIIAVEEAKVTAGGAEVESDAKIYKAGTTEATGYQAVPVVCKGDLTDTTKYAQENAGYYLDIPMWIRTNKTTTDSSDINVDCTVSITNGTNTTDGKLKNAVRVAIVPVTVDKTQAGFASSVPSASNGLLSVQQAATGITGQSAVIFGLTKSTFNNAGVLPANTEADTYGAVTKAPLPEIIQAASTLRNAMLDNVDDGDDDANNKPATTTFKLPSATKDDYSGCAFVVRIWLEGESVDCLDATANQDWRIDLHFELCPGTSDSHAHATAPTI